VSAEGAPAVGDPAFWEGLYARQGDRWELGRPAPPLSAYFASRPRAPGDRVAVPGCGRGHDARFLARLGYRVRGFDFAAPAISEARALAEQEPGLDVVFEQRDVFGLAAEYREAFDGVWEYTSFCAIDPARRAEYVRVIRGLLRPAGWLLGCFFPVREGTGGPPFPATREEIEALWLPRFDFIEASAPEASAEGRRGQEWLVVARARD
jgi:SAM-dependent methyltransferase